MSSLEHVCSWKVDPALRLSSDPVGSLSVSLSVFLLSLEFMYSFGRALPVKSLSDRAFLFNCIFLVSCRTREELGELHFFRENHNTGFKEPCALLSVPTRKQEG